MGLLAFGQCSKHEKRGCVGNTSRCNSWDRVCWMAEKLVGQSLLDKVCWTEHDSKSLSAVGVRDYWPTAAGISRVDVL
jgi:hypothetical protein